MSVYLAGLSVVVVGQSGERAYVRPIIILLSIMNFVMYLFI